MLVIKNIKFDMPIDGTTVRNVEELRDHFTIEILAHLRSGLLGRWLASRKLQEQLTAIELLKELDDQAAFKGLCAVFEVAADDAVIAVLFNDPTPKFALTTKEVLAQDAAADKVIHLEDVLPIQKGELKLFTGRDLIIDPNKSLDFGDTDLILQSPNGAVIFKSCRTAKLIFGRYVDRGDGTVLDIATRAELKTLGYGRRYLDLGDDVALDIGTGTKLKILGCDRRYLDLDDGTVLDITTNLQWMRCALGQTWNGQTCVGDADKFNWEDAKKAAKNCGFADYTDWRLPTRDELKTLIVTENKPTIDSVVFPNTPNAQFWSSSRPEKDSEFYSAVYLDFTTGKLLYTNNEKPSVGSLMDSAMSDLMGSAILNIVLQTFCVRLVRSR